MNRRLPPTNGSEWKIDGQIIIVARGNEWNELETSIFVKSLLRLCLASTFVCRPPNGKPARHKHNCVTQRGGKMTRFEHSLISYYLISFEFELKYSDNFFDTFSIREDRAAIYRRIEKCIQLYYCRNCIFIRNISRDNIEKNIRT